MVCDACKQQQATVHLTEIVNDQMTELHLCEACANQKGAQVESHFGLADLEVVGNPLLDFIDRHPPATGAEHVGKNFFGECFVDRPRVERGIGDKPVQSALELADIR